MGIIDNENYYKLLDRIADLSNRPVGFIREEYVKCLTDICDLFNVTKGVTEFYVNPKLEREGKGEIMIDRDIGKADVVLVSRRIVPESGVVIKGTLYTSSELPQLTDEDIAKLDLLHRIMLSFIARNRLQRTVFKFAYYDEDGYPNRRAFMKFIFEKIEKNQVAGNTAICINLKHFTLINQDIGRKMGDVVMKNYFERLNSMVGENGTICKLGGDTFLIFVPGELRDKLLETFAGIPIRYDIQDESKYVYVAARAGIFDITEENRIDEPGQIIDRVHPALHMAKQRGYNVVVYDQKMEDDRNRVMKVRREFAEGLYRDEFHPYYQPKVDVETGKVVGAEALCRWIKDGKMVMPMEFIPILEMNKDICRLDFHILEIVCKDVRRWLDEGRTVPRVSVNLSRKHMTDPELLDKLISIIDKYDIPHDYIEIELTETTTDVEFKDLSRVVCGLQGEGISTSVDDFGNGYSSLNLIRVIPWNVIKIDRTLLPIDGDNADSNTGLMYEHIVAMAHDMGLECITEGVETLNQVMLLKKNKCRIAQGFYFDKAMPAEEFEKKLDGCPYLDKLE